MENDKSAGSTVIIIVLMVVLLLGGSCVIGGGALLFLGMAPVRSVQVMPAKAITSGATTSSITHQLAIRRVEKEADGSWVVEADLLNTGTATWTNFEVQSPKPRSH